MSHQEQQVQEPKSAHEIRMEDAAKRTTAIVEFGKMLEATRFKLVDLEDADARQKEIDALETAAAILADDVFEPFNGGLHGTRRDQDNRRNFMLMLWGAANVVPDTFKVACERDRTVKKD